MTEQELRKKSRKDLLEILVKQSELIDSLKEELEETKKELEKKQIVIANAGSIAQASLELTHIFEEAQKAADLYLQNVKSINNGEV
ncbi:MAG: DNA repair protein [Firmicutes bacterium]|nr:DNA repair protein [Bacillota bacterium]